MIVGETMSDFCDDPANDGPSRPHDPRVPGARGARTARPGQRVTATRMPPRSADVCSDLMTEKVGIFRDGDGCSRRSTSCWCSSRAQSTRIGLRSAVARRQPGAGQRLSAAAHAQAGTERALGALKRTESRGAHYRVDYPQRNDATGSTAPWPPGRIRTDPLPTLAYEALDVMRMELPPGWRGYGANDHIPHPDAAARQAEVDALRQQHGEADALRGGCRSVPGPAAGGSARAQRTTGGRGVMTATVIATAPRRLTFRSCAMSTRRTPTACRTGSASRSRGRRHDAVHRADRDPRDPGSPSLQVDFVCRAGICGSCGMLINGRPGLACRTLTKDLPDEISLAPLPGFELIGDLSVNTGKWMRGMSERLETWVHTTEEGDRDRARGPDGAGRWPRPSTSSNAASSAAAASPPAATAQMREDFVGAVGLNKIARFRTRPAR
jgi:hypothetical protein